MDEFLQFMLQVTVRALVPLLHELESLHVILVGLRGRWVHQTLVLALIRAV